MGKKCKSSSHSELIFPIFLLLSPSGAPNILNSLFSKAPSRREILGCHSGAILLRCDDVLIG